jgi:hypothetical protein
VKQLASSFRIAEIEREILAYNHFTAFLAISCGERHRRPFRLFMSENRPLYFAMIVASNWLKYFLKASGCSDMGKWPMPSMRV